MSSETDVVKILIDDGLDSIDWKTLRKYENISTISLVQLRDELGMGSWAVRIAYNNLFGGVIIQQNSGEGNRKHYHPDADENWIIMDGVWEWWIEGKGKKIVKQNDIIVVPKGIPHLITCIEGPGARYAITKPDVNHVYVNEE
jgi:mannose-6-phosphate isomerase-like protein (cupin superfamily)